MADAISERQKLVPTTATEVTVVNCEKFVKRLHVFMEMEDEIVVLQMFSDDELESEKKTRLSDVVFARALKEHGIDLLQKSQTPPMREKKKNAIKRLQNELLVSIGMSVSEQQIYKKINNMKTRVKSKTDKKKTGNLPISLNDGERIMYELMGAEENPAINRLEFGKTAGARKKLRLNLEEKENLYETQLEASESQDADLEPQTFASTSTSSASIGKKIQKPSSSRARAEIPEKKSRTRDGEAPDTARLTTIELQRMVLLKQLRVLEVQEHAYNEFRKVLPKIEDYLDQKTNNVEILEN